MPQTNVRMAWKTESFFTQPSSVGAPGNEGRNERTVGRPRACARPLANSL